MKALLFVLPALVCQAQDPALPAQVAMAQRLSTDQLLTLQAMLAADPAPAEKKAYHQLYLDYVLASRRLPADPKTGGPLLERAMKGLEGSKDPERMALMGACLGLKIGLSPMSGITLAPKAMGLFDQAVAMAPGNPRPLLLRAVHVLHSPAFVGGGGDKAIPLFEAAAAAADKAAAPADPWAPAWGRVEALSWLALAQARAGRKAEAEATVARARTLDPVNGFLDNMVLPALKGQAK